MSRHVPPYDSRKSAKTQTRCRGSNGWHAACLSNHADPKVRRKWRRRRNWNCSDPTRKGPENEHKRVSAHDDLLYLQQNRTSRSRMPNEEQDPMPTLQPNRPSTKPLLVPRGKQQWQALMVSSPPSCASKSWPSPPSSNNRQTSTDSCIKWKWSERSQSNELCLHLHWSP